MAYTQEQLDTTREMVSDLLKATERKDPGAFVSIPALKAVGEELTAYNINEFNKYLSWAPQGGGAAAPG